MESDQHREPWNKVKLVGQKPLLKPKDIWAIRIHLQNTHQVRDLAMFNLVVSRFTDVESAHRSGLAEDEAFATTSRPPKSIAIRSCVTPLAPTISTRACLASGTSTTVPRRPPGRLTTSSSSTDLLCALTARSASILASASAFRSAASSGGNPRSRKILPSVGVTCSMPTRLILSCCCAARRALRLRRFDLVIVVDLSIYRHA